MQRYWDVTSLISPSTCLTQADPLLHKYMFFNLHPVKEVRSFEEETEIHISNNGETEVIGESQIWQRMFNYSTHEHFMIYWLFHERRAEIKRKIVALQITAYICIYCMCGYQPARCPFTSFLISHLPYMNVNQKNWMKSCEAVVKAKQVLVNKSYRIECLLPSSARRVCELAGVIFSSRSHSSRRGIGECSLLGGTKEQSTGGNHTFPLCWKEEGGGEKKEKTAPTLITRSQQHRGWWSKELLWNAGISRATRVRPRNTKRARLAGGGQGGGAAGREKTSPTLISNHISPDQDAFVHSVKPPHWCFPFPQEFFFSTPCVFLATGILTELSKHSRKACWLFKICYKNSTALFKATSY